MRLDYLFQNIYLLWALCGISYLYKKEHDHTMPESDFYLMNRKQVILSHIYMLDQSWDHLHKISIKLDFIIKFLATGHVFIAQDNFY